MAMASISSSSRRLTLSLARDLIATGRISKQELASYCHALAVAGEERWNLNAFTRIFSRELVMEQAAAAEWRPLAGIPISVKANLAVREAPLTASSKILASHSVDDDMACGYDAQVVQNLRDMGAVVIGITQMDEFGMGSLGTNLGEGATDGRLVTKNPLQYLEHVSRKPDDWVREIKKPYDAILDDHITSGMSDADLWYAGGSSCGSAASVSHGSSLLSVASDTGGSIRLPAAWCGIAGFKPSYGRLSRKGLVSYASSLDTVGLLAPTVECASIAFGCLTVAAKNNGITDSTMIFQDKERVPVSKEKGSLRVGIPSAFSIEECPKAITDAWEEAAIGLEQSGATLVEIPSDLISPELIRRSLAAYYILASAEASSNLSRYDGLRYGLSVNESYVAASAMSDLTQLERQYAATRSQGFGREVVRRILSGTSVLSSDRFHTHYEAATKVRAMVAAQLREALKSVDVLLTPTCLSLPNKDQTDNDPTGMFANDVLTVPISLACLPAISIPWQEGSPIGLQIVGAADDRVLEVATTLEEILNARQ